MLQHGNEEAVYLETARKVLCTWTPRAWLLYLEISLKSSAGAEVAAIDFSNLTVMALTFTCKLLDKPEVVLSNLQQLLSNKLFTSLILPCDDCNPFLQPVKRIPQCPAKLSERNPCSKPVSHHCWLLNTEQPYCCLPSWRRKTFYSLSFFEIYITHKLK